MRFVGVRSRVGRTSCCANGNERFHSCRSSSLRFARSVDRSRRERLTTPFLLLSFSPSPSLDAGWLTGDPAHVFTVYEEQPIPEPPTPPPEPELAEGEEPVRATRTSFFSPRADRVLLPPDRSPYDLPRASSVVSHGRSSIRHLLPDRPRRLSKLTHRRASRR